MMVLGDAFQQSPTRVDEWLDRRLKEYDTPVQISLRRALIFGVEISLDRDRFDQAVRNVIDNACQAFDGATTVGDGAAECQVAVATRRVGRRLEVSISDNGVGISPQAMARVFEPLYSSKTFGVGLGMPLVRQIMEQHGGGVKITSEEGRGTEVVLWRPLTAEARGDTA
jgi:signal transduction histidine kinase